MLSTPYKNFPLVCLLFGIVLTIWGLLIKDVDFGSQLVGTGVGLSLTGILLFWFFQPSRGRYLLNKRDITKTWNNSDRQSDYRLISITPKNFSFKATNSELIWQWQALKDFYEGSQGFEIVFYSGHRRCISKRVFQDDTEINTFKKLIAEYRK